MTKFSPAAPVGARHDFRLFWLSGAVSRLGSHASGAVLPILVLALGGSPVTAGLLGTVGAGARVLVSPVAGVYADRHSRRRLMVGSALVAAAAMLVVALLVAGRSRSWSLLFGSVAVEGAASGVLTAAAAASLRAVLPKDNPEGALGLIQAREQGAQLAGPGLGGLLYQATAWLPFLADGISYLVAAACVRSMSSELRPPRPQARATVRAGLREGLRFLWLTPFLRFVVLWAGGVNLIVGALYLEIVVAARLRGATAGQIGLMLTLAGAAGLIGALATPLLLRLVRADLFVVVASWLMAIGMLLPITTTAIWIGAGTLGIVSLLSPGLSVVLQARAIMLTPDEMQGRVGSSLGAIAESTEAVAPLLGGLLVQTWSSGTIAGVFAAGLALLAGYAWRGMRHLRPTATGHQPAGGPAPASAASPTPAAR